MSFTDAESALNGAIAEDFGDTPAPVPAPAPVEQAPAAPATPEGPVAPVQPVQTRDEFGRFTQPTPAAPVPSVDTTPDLFEGTAINPDTLPAELQPLVKQLQAAFTTKTQGLAEQRRQFESLGNLDEVRQAAELYRALQDPGYLQEFHGELTKALEAQGLSTGQARAEAARQIEEQSAPTQSISDALARLKDDPELGPLGDAFTQLRSELDEFKSSQTRREEAEQLAHAQMAMAGELQRQEMAILQSHPDYQQEDIDLNYELSAFFDGSLIEANQRIENYVQNRLERYLAQKTPAPASGPVSGSGGTSEVPVEVTSLQQGYKAALEHLAQAGIDTLGE